MGRVDPDRFHFETIQSDPERETGYKSNVKMKFEVSFNCVFDSLRETLVPSMGTCAK